MDKFCTNCGKENNKKICPHCGVKKNATHQFCEWCGSPTNENATICTVCKENIKVSYLEKIFNIVSILGIIALIFAIVMSLESSAILPAILFAIGIILLLPITKKAIKYATHNDISIRKPLSIMRVFLVIILAFIGIGTQPATEFKVYTEDATKAAEVIFHEEVSLKNEASFVINDSKVTYLTEPYNGHENLRYVTVVIDYSAQNGWGGNNRNNYTINILFDTENGTYYRLDGTVIKS